MTLALTVFIVFALASLPIGLVMVLSGLTGAVTIGGIDFLEIIADRFYSGVSGFVLIAVPYFIFTAELMNRAGLTDRLVAFANSLFGSRIPAPRPSHQGGAPCRIRTCDLRLRRPLLYPTELRAHSPHRHCSPAKVAHRLPGPNRSRCLPA